MSAGEESEEASTLTNQERLSSPRLFPQRVLNVTPHLPFMMDTEVLVRLVGIICKVLMDGIVIKVRTPRESLHIFPCGAAPAEDALVRGCPQVLLFQKGGEILPQDILSGLYPTCAEAH